MEDLSKHLYRILIVDGSGPFSELLRTLLQGPDRSVDVRDTVYAAQEYLQHNPVDMAFLHPTRPGVSCSSLARQIIDRNPRAHVVVCSNHIREEIGDAARVMRLDNQQREHCAATEVMRLADSCKTD